MTADQLAAINAIIAMNESIIDQNYAVLNIMFPVVKLDEDDGSPTLQ